jgi:hypothetical protein
MTATVNGVLLAYSDIGQGLPLVCLHGGMGVDAGSLHVPGILDLARMGIRLVIPDQRGHGRSERSSQGDYSHETWASDVHDLAQGLGLRQFALLGHSYGGFLALGVIPIGHTWSGLRCTFPGPRCVRSTAWATFPLWKRPHRLGSRSQLSSQERDERDLALVIATPAT